MEREQLQKVMYSLYLQLDELVVTEGNTVTLTLGVDEIEAVMAALEIAGEM